MQPPLCVPVSWGRLLCAWPSILYHTLISVQLHFFPCFPTQEAYFFFLPFPDFVQLSALSISGIVGSPRPSVLSPEQLETGLSDRFSSCAWLCPLARHPGCGSLGGSHFSSLCPRSELLLFPRIDRMLISPRRPTVEKMASRKASPLHITHRRMVVSMPNLQDISLPELPPRNSSLRIMDTSSCKSSSPGETTTLLRVLAQHGSQ